MVVRPIGPMRAVVGMAVLVALTACGGGVEDRAPRSVSRASAAGRVFQALDTVVRDGRIVAVAPDGRTLASIDVETGEERWRASLGGEADWATVHDLGAGRVLVQRAGRLTVVDLANGEVVASRDAPPAWQGVWEEGGACALVHDCSLSPIACDDARPLGPPLRGATIDFHGPGPDDSARTCDAALSVLGRAGELSLYVAGPLEGPEPTREAEVIALDAAGEIRWRSASVACRQCTPVGLGVAPDGSVGWTTDGLETSLVVRVFDSGDGRLLATHTLGRLTGFRYPPIMTGWVNEGLLIQADVATLHRPDGRVIWRREAPPDLLILPEGLRVPGHPLALDRFTEIDHVGAADGFPMWAEPCGDRVVRIDDDGSPYLATRTEAGDRGGGSVRPPERFTFDRDRGGSRAMLGDRVMLTTPGDAWVLGEHRSERGAWLVVAEPQPPHPDRVHVLYAR